MKKIFFFSLLVLVALTLTASLAKASDGGKKFKERITTVDMYFSENEKQDIRVEACPATVEFNEGYRNRMIISVSEYSESAVKKAKEKIVKFLEQKRGRDRQGKIYK